MPVGARARERLCVRFARVMMHDPRAAGEHNGGAMRVCSRQAEECRAARPGHTRTVQVVERRHGDLRARSGCLRPHTGCSVERWGTSRTAIRSANEVPSVSAALVCVCDKAGPMLTSSKYIFFPSPCSINQSRFLSTTIGQDAFAAPRRLSIRVSASHTHRNALTRRRVLVEERQHVDVDKVDRVEHVLRAPALLVPVRELAHRHGDAEAREVRLGEQDLLREHLVREHVVVQRLRAKLHAARDEFSTRVRVQGREQRVAPRLPDVPAREAELGEQRQRAGWKEEESRARTQMRACTPSVFAQAASTMSSLSRGHPTVSRKRTMYHRGTHALEPVAVARAVQAHIARVEVVADVCELAMKRFEALACH